MPAKISLPLPPRARVVVNKNSWVKRNSCLAQATSSDYQQGINIASLLKVPAAKISRYLTCSIGGRVSKGEIIARRKKFFTELVVRATFNARVCSVDLTKGLVVLEKELPETTKVTSPVPGRIAEIKSDVIELEFNGDLIEANDGYGSASGELFFLADEEESYYNINYQVAGKIVITKPSELVSAKLQALDAAGIITWSAEGTIKIPFVVVKKTKISQLAKFDGREAIIDADHGFVAILDS